MTDHFVCVGGTIELDWTSRGQPTIEAVGIACNMDRLIAGLLRPEAYDHPVTELRVMETHISWVILTGQFAYKLKKPVDLGFADFTTLNRRHYFCGEEVRLNRRLAPDLYLGVRPIYGTRDCPSFQGPGIPIEFAVQMHQFDQSQLVPAVLERNELRVEQVEGLAKTIAAFHSATAVAGLDSDYGTPPVIRQAATDNFESLEQSHLNHETTGELRSWSEEQYRKLENWFQQRHDGGHIRECHGDMHLGNMVVLNDSIRIFDCLEFNEALHWIDVLAEVAFVVMDLQVRGRYDLAVWFLNIWLEQTGDYLGLTGWRWYVVYRAMVRAKVAALRIGQSDLPPNESASKRRELEGYLRLARSWMERPSKAIIVMHGLSGSGKSYVSKRLCQTFSLIRLRSDVERKRLFGQWGSLRTALLDGDPYAAQVTERVYRRSLSDPIPAILEAGFSVLIDATCLQAWQREHFADIAAAEAAKLIFLDIQAEPETIRRRILEREASRQDPSDASFAVLDHQLSHQVPLSSEEQIHSLPVNTDDALWWQHLEARLAARLKS